jgi:sporulation protein YlmC with PRC-barrel domain
MLQSIKELYGKKISASDGDIGHVRDFYFNDQQWVVRYVIAETGSWMTGFLVLLSPHAFGTSNQTGDALVANLTRQQIENSPPIESHKPVSRQYEEEYYRYYGWPSYWEGGDLWGVGGFHLPPPPYPPPAEQGIGQEKLISGEDPGLQSTRAVSGYHIQTSEGEIGHVVDFIIDDENWAICQLVVETGHWFSGKKIAISPQLVGRISYEESNISVNMTKQAILEAPEYHLPAVGAANRDTGNKG